MADYSYAPVPRRCGGSHTLTYPYRRSRLQHLPQGAYPTEEIQIAMKVGGYLGEGGPLSPEILKSFGKNHQNSPQQPSAWRQFLKLTQLKSQGVILCQEKRPNRPLPTQHNCLPPQVLRMRLPPLLFTLLLCPGTTPNPQEVGSTVCCQESGEDSARNPGPAEESSGSCNSNECVSISTA